MSAQTRTGARPAAPTANKITQTYSTADVTIPASPAALILTATDIAAKTASDTLTDSAATNPTEANFDQLSKDLGTKINAHRLDVIEVKEVLNTLIDALQAEGILL